MKEAKAAAVLAATLVAFFVGVETAHKISKQVVSRHIPFAHCRLAVGYEYDANCAKR